MVTYSAYNKEEKHEEMDNETHRLIKRLNGCTFLPATTEKRFIRQLASLSIEHQLTEKQLLFLGQVAYRYRKQMQRELCCDDKGELYSR